MTTPIVELSGVTRSYGSPPTVALNSVDLRIDEGEMLAIVGPSGSGKSTMLNIIGSLDRASNGQTVIAGQDVGDLSDTELSALRAYTIGFVFQQFHGSSQLRVWWAARRCLGRGRGLPRMGVLTLPTGKTSTCLTLHSPALT